MNNLLTFFVLLSGRFSKRLFWFDDILRDAIASEHLSDKVFVPSHHRVKPGKIDSELLDAGLKSYFGRNELFTVVYALSPPRFREFLKSDIGKKLASRYLEANWRFIQDAIARDKRDRRILRGQRMKRLKPYYEQLKRDEEKRKNT